MLLLPPHISKEHFRPGGMAPSEWTRSVRAVRDTPVEDDSAPGVNTTGRVAYCPPIAVSPFLLTLSVYTKYTLFFPIIWSHSLFLRFRWSTQLRGSLRPGSIISSHPHPTLLEPGWLLMMAWRDREGWVNFMFLGDGRGDGTNDHEKLGLKRISCASQFTIPIMAAMSPNPACNNTDTRSSQPNEASCTPDFSYPLLSSTSFSSSSPISLLLIHISTIIAEHKVKSSLSISPWHDHELTPSTAYTEYSIHWVQHSKIVCLPFILTITSWPLNVASASGVPPYTIYRHQPALHESSIVKLPCHIPTVAS